MLALCIATLGYGINGKRPDQRSSFQFVPLLAGPPIFVHYLNLKSLSINAKIIRWDGFCHEGIKAARTEMW
jgi:hypothetical protein